MILKQNTNGGYSSPIGNWDIGTDVDDIYSAMANMDQYRYSTYKQHGFCFIDSFDFVCMCNSF